ncbi:uncharacterized protein LOC122252240 [Penaeus japonicus]|uniref:uncharacterized protein LOC122252240 n=1 Tax=Penaeus japonicus TaxID=27405 RepID=UPI001C71618A|nr:uncharacterized protein LOC122252240 [Penaeus japonicus]
MHSSSVLAFAVWCVLACDDSAAAGPLPNRTLREFPPVVDGLELQRVGGGGDTAVLRKDYTDAIYAARFAIELDRLEKQRNEIFSDFIFSGFMNEEVPRELPSDLQRLSRTSSPPLASSSVLSSPVTLGRSVTSSSSFRFPGEVRRPPLVRGAVGAVGAVTAAPVRTRSFPPVPRARLPPFGSPFIRRARS